MNLQTLQSTLFPRCEIILNFWITFQDNPLGRAHKKNEAPKRHTMKAPLLIIIWTIYQITSGKCPMDFFKRLIITIIISNQVADSVKADSSIVP